MFRIAPHEKRAHRVRKPGDDVGSRFPVKRQDDVKAFRARSLDPAPESQILQEIADVQCGLAQPVEILAGGIEVEDADIRVVQPGSARHPDVRRDRVLVGHPQERADIGHERMMDDPVFFWNLDSFEPVRKSFRDILLPEPFLANPRRVPLHRHRPPAQMRQHDGRDRLVVRSELALRDAVFGEEDLVWMRDHRDSRTTSRADLSKRTPSSRGWRSFPCTVHSMNPAWTTISGRTQWACRGRPLPFVNGGAWISSGSSRARNSSRSFVSKPVPIFPANAKSSPS